jgi:hypothetical protein
MKHLCIVFVYTMSPRKIILERNKEGENISEDLVNGI